MGTSLRNLGTVGGPPLAGSQVSLNQEQTHSFWSRYGWLLAAVWIVFLTFPVLSIAESTLPIAAQVAGYGLILPAAVFYVGFQLAPILFAFVLSGALVPRRIRPKPGTSSRSP